MRFSSLSSRLFGRVTPFFILPIYDIMSSI